MRAMRTPATCAAAGRVGADRRGRARTPGPSPRPRRRSPISSSVRCTSAPLWSPPEWTMRLWLWPPSRVERRARCPSCVGIERRAQPHQVADRLRRLGDERRARRPRRTARRRPPACRGRGSRASRSGRARRRGRPAPTRVRAGVERVLGDDEHAAHRAGGQRRRRARRHPSRARRRRRRAPRWRPARRDGAERVRSPAITWSLRRAATACRSRSSARRDRRARSAMSRSARSTSSVRVAQRAQQLVGRDHLHVLAHRRPVDRLEDRRAGSALRSWCSMPVSVATSTLRRRGLLGRGDHARRSTGSSSAPAGTTPAPTRYSALVAQPHSGWMNSSASGSASTRAFRSAPLMPACTWHSPIQMCMFVAAGEALHVGAEELVGQNRISRSAGIDCDHVDRVRRRAADVGLGLHRRGGVDVADDHDRAGVLGLPRPQLVGGDRLGEQQPARSSGISTVLS